MVLCVAIAGCCDDDVHDVYLELSPGIITTGARLQLGDTLTVKAHADSNPRGLFCHGQRLYSNVDQPSRFTYRSTDTSIVAIDERGFLTARGLGTTTLTATTARVVSLPVQVTVE